MRESLGGKPKGAMKVKVTVPGWLIWDPYGCRQTTIRAAHHSPIPVACNGVEVERIR